MKRLVAALERWSEGKPKALIWLVAAAVCWLLFGALIALPFAVPAFSADAGRDAGAERDCARISETQARRVRWLVDHWTGLPPAAEAPRAYLGAEAVAALPTTRPDGAVGATLRVPDGAGGWHLVVVLPCRERVDAGLLAILAHERVHVLQHHAGAAWPPPEAPAARVQRRFRDYTQRTQATTAR